VLYEILTGRPPYAANDTLELLLLAREARVTPPRRLAAWVPRPLEAACLKALQARPEDRYATAAELADEVKRWLAGEPVKAWPEPWGAKALRWVRKNRVLAGAAAAALAVALAAFGRAAYQERQRGQVRLAQARERDREARTILEEVEGMRAAARDMEPALAKLQLSQALKMVERAAALLGEGGADEQVRRRVERVRAEFAHEYRDQEMVARLEEARLKAAVAAGGKFDTREVVPEFRRAFAWYLGEGDIRRLPEAEAARRLASSRIRAELAAALDDWSRWAEGEDEKGWGTRLAAAIDDEPLRRQIREARLRKDRAELVRLARAKGLMNQPAATLALLGSLLASSAAVKEAEGVLRQAQLLHPGDFWINHDLGVCLGKLSPARKEEAVRFLTAAVALRGQSAGAHVSLGAALHAYRRSLEAEQVYRRAIRLKPDYAAVHYNLGIVLCDLARHQEGEACCREAIRLRPDDANAYYNLANALGGQGRAKDAEEAYRLAIKHKPDHLMAHSFLGIMLQLQGRFPEALACFRRRLALAPPGDHGAKMIQEMIAQTERKILLDEKLPAILSGSLRPADDQERADLAALAAEPFKGHYAAAATLFAEAFAASPRLADAHRFGAAAAAALAGAGRGTGAGALDATDRAQLRYAALGYLQDQLAHEVRRLTGPSPDSASNAWYFLNYWRKDPDFSGIRDKQHLARLPEAEQVAWNNFWAHVDALIDRHKPSK
jgi:serine/threonine-protein kinase